MTRLLLEHGVDIDVKDQHGKTVLHIAIGCNDTDDVVRMLLAHGIYCDVKDENGKASLHQATRSGRPSIVHLLVERGVDINAKDQDGQTTLHIAVTIDDGPYSIRTAARIS